MTAKPQKTELAAMRHEALKAEKFLREVTKLTNRAKQYGAYSERNLTNQIREMERARADRWEINILIRAREKCRTQARTIWKYLEQLSKKEKSL